MKMSQKPLDGFFKSRKRQRPVSCKDDPQSLFSDAEPCKDGNERKRFKQEIKAQPSEAPQSKAQPSKAQPSKALPSKALPSKAQSSKAPPSSSNTVEVKYHKCQQEVLSSLGMGQGGGKEQPLASHGSLSLSHRVLATSCSAGQPKQSNMPSFATSKSIQRRLFADDEDGAVYSMLKEGPSKDMVLKSHLPGLSPQKMKESLKQCAKFDQLKKKLASFNKASLKLKAFETGTPTQAGGLKDSLPTLEFEILSPVKTPRKNVQSPSPKKTPAYKRFQHLIEDMPPTLALPYKLRFLKEAFHCLDTVASFLHNRKEIITFKKLKASVQEMLNRNFTETQLAQIKAVFPFAYIFRREKDLPNHKVTPNNKNKWQLTLQINTNFEADMKMCAPDAAQQPPTSCEYQKLTPAMLIKRGKVFHASLLDILLQHHQEFLQSLDPPVTLDWSRIMRWHPDFQLEAVPEVEAAPLPLPPADEVGGSARDVLERAHALFDKYPQLQQCLQEVAGEPRQQPEQEQRPSSPQAGSSAAAPAAAADADGLPAGLLARIRAREAARQQRVMTRTPAESRRLEMLCRLPQLARGLRAVFVTERRSALTLDATVARLADSDRSQLGRVELGRHLELLAAEAPRFVHLVPLKSGTFVKVDRAVDVNVVAKQLEEKLEQAKR